MSIPKTTSNFIYRMVPDTSNKWSIQVELQGLQGCVLDFSQWKFAHANRQKIGNREKKRRPALRTRNICRIFYFFERPPWRLLIFALNLRVALFLLNAIGYCFRFSKEHRSTCLLRAAQITFWVLDFTCSFTWLLMAFVVNKPRGFGHLSSPTYCTKVGWVWSSGWT